MRRLSIIAAVVAGGLVVAVVPRLFDRGRAPVAPVPAAAAVAPAGAALAPASGGDLQQMLASGRKTRQQPRPTQAERRAARAEAIARGSAAARSGALRALALEDRAAADAIARQQLADHVLFADAARLLLVRPDGAPDGADLVLIRRALRTGEHDDASRVTVAALLLEALVRADSPEAARFAASLRTDDSPRVRAVGERQAGGVKVARASAAPR